MDFRAEYRKLIHLVTREPVRGFDFVDCEIEKKSIPEFLRFVYEIAGSAALNQTHNRLFVPPKLKVDEKGFVAFAEENQGVCIWGYRASDGNGDVMVHWRSLEDGPEGWAEEGRLISEFLVSLGYWSASMGAADVSAVGESGDVTRKKVEALPILWKTSDFTARGDANHAVILTTGGQFYAFGNNADKLSAFVDSLEPEWVDME